MDDQNTPPCCGLVIKNTANGKEFYVCKKCHQEVTRPSLEDRFEDGENALDQFFEAWTKKFGLDAVKSFITPNPFFKIAKRPADCTHEWSIWASMDGGNLVGSTYRCKHCNETRDRLP